MTRNNELQHIEGKILDFDAVSLYPSAMSRIQGFLKGKPKVIEEFSKEFLDSVDGYIIEIVISKVNIRRDFPLMSYVEDGIRHWSNDMDMKTMIVDKIQLEDLIKFHDIEFDAVRGYYFNEGFNPMISETIKTLFNNRVEAKKVGNKIEVTYKLLMNALYGKSIIKPVMEDSRIFQTEEKMKKFVLKNFNAISKVIQIADCNKYIVKCITPINKHFNNAHVGFSILTMSKRIMNEVMCTAEDNQVDIYYQDTDSMHLKDESLNKLVDVYNKEYERELVGVNLGQFHSDFKLKGANGEVYSKLLIALGKKSYLDVITDGTLEGYHVRMKGISKEAIDHYCDIKKVNMLELYTMLSEGTPVEFDLLCSGNKAIFKYNNNISYEMAKEFRRTVCFKKSEVNT